MVTPSESGADAGTQGNANPQGSSAKPGDEQNSQGVTITRAEYDGLLKTIQRLDSEDRSKKDKAVANANKAVQDLSKRVEGLDERVKPLLERAGQFIQAGDNVDVALNKASEEFNEAQDREDMRDFLKTWRTGGTSALGGAGAINTTAIAQELGLNPNSAEFTQLAAEYGKNPVRLAVEAGKLADRMASTSTANPSTAAPESSGMNAVKQDNNAKLQSDYNKEQQAIIKSIPAGDQRIRKLAELKVSYRQKGLSV